VSTTQLYRKIKALTGYSPVEFIRIVKLQKAYEMLVERHKSVKEVCYLSGFNNVSYFIKCFKEQFGVTPASLRDFGGIEEQIPDNAKKSKN
ncbi:MAG: helix-turn-helix transcriptional regulator, partial [Bacteroidales bacterium]|nr:helix-turn-helix transcriptional regulator [Bacteroidales bacterium]